MSYNKKKIAILLTGEIRANPLNNENLYYNKDLIDKIGYYMNIINPLKDKYDLNFFIATNKINLLSVNKYFGDYVKSCIQLDFEDIDEPLDLKELLDNYYNYYNNKKKNNKLYENAIARPQYIYMYYKKYCAYYEMKKYEQRKNIKHDYIIWTRLDLKIIKNLDYVFKLFDYNNYYLIKDWDVIYIGLYNIMCHQLELIFKYGIYNYFDQKKIGSVFENSRYNWLKDFKSNCWSESPEVQSFSHFLDYIIKNKINIKNFGKYLDMTYIFKDNYEMGCQKIIDWDNLKDIDCISIIKKNNIKLKWVEPKVGNETDSSFYIYVSLSTNETFNTNKFKVTMYEECDIFIEYDTRYITSIYKDNVHTIKVFGIKPKNTISGFKINYINNYNILSDDLYGCVCLK